MLVPVGTLSANVGLLLGRTASVCARDILLALGLGAHLSFILARRLLFGFFFVFIETSASVFVSIHTKRNRLLLSIYRWKVIS